MRFVTLFSYGPNWQTGRTVYQQGTPIEGQLDSMRRRFDEGVLLLGGPFDDGGGIAVIEARDEDEAVTLLDLDPAVMTGVLSYRLHRLHAYFDAFASVRTEMSVADLASQRQVG
jgi:uncharacterized protein YciI